MKRAFVQKAKPVQSRALKCKAMVGQDKSVLPETNNRRARNSAVTIGLAISMGASSLFLPKQGEVAVAAEPAVSEPTTTAFPISDSGDFSSFTARKADSDVTSTLQFGGIEHQVETGQTLGQIARLYQVDAEAIATSNGLELDSLLHSGQVIEIPSAKAVRSDAGQALETKAEQSDPEFESARAIDAEKISLVPASEPASEPSSDRLSVGLSLPLDNREAASERPTPELPNLLPASDAQPTPLSLDATPTTSSEDSSSARPAAPVRSALPESETSISGIDPAPTLNNPSPEDAPSDRASSESIARDSQEFVESDSESATVEPNRPDPQTIAAAPILPDRPIAGTYRVGAGDTLYKIARKHGLSPADLIQANDIGDPNRIEVGQQLQIPVSDTQDSPATNVAFVSGLDSTPYPAIAPEPQNLPADAPATPEGDRISSARGSVPSSDRLDLAGASLMSDPWSGSKRSPAPTPISHAEAGTDNSYADGLRSEIGKLRQKYQTQPEQLSEEANAITRTTVARSLLDGEVSSEDSTQARVNPEFNPDQHVENLQQDVRQLRQRQQQSEATRRRSSENFQLAAAPPPEVTETPAAEESQTQDAAVAPLGSEAYEPIIQPRTVSPDLPPLSPPENYLPDKPATFNGYGWPAKGVLTSGYGWRWGRMHKGIDIAGPIGTPIVAAAAGVVTYAQWNSGGYGNLVEIEHPDGSLTLYAHNNRILVNEGQKVDRGQQVAEMGSTGYSTGPHLHFEIHPPGQGAVNPMAYLPNR